MGLWRGGEQFLFDLVVDCQDWSDNFWQCISDVFRELFEEVVNQVTEDHVDGVIVEFGVCNDIKVSDETRSNECSSSAWWSHRRQADQSFKFHELKVFSVVPSFVVHVLSDQLNWRLCSVLLLFGHVEIVHEDDALFTDGRSVDTFSEFVQFSVDCVLCLVAAGLGTKHHSNILILFAQLFINKLANVKRFTCTRWSHIQYMLFIGNQKL